ncbi:hypothetical protein DPV78_005154 [Talaromyces pinophilus]|nr:hypothetical protein DPV78_005154 [Talaromyces pinophilus]
MVQISVFSLPAALFSFVSFALGATALAEYLRQQRALVALVPKADIYDQAFIIAASYHVFASVFTGITAGGLGLFGRPIIIGLFWKICISLAVLFITADAFALTIVVAMKTVSFGSSVGPRVTVYLDNATQNFGVPLDYRQNKKALVAVVFVWFAWVGILISCVTLYLNKSKSLETVEKEEEKKSEQNPGEMGV